MNIFTTLIDLFIKPLELLFETVFTLTYMVCSNPGTVIVFLSVFMNFLLLPLYKQADAMQKQTIQEEKKLHRWTEHIKQNFKGDERYMILQTYYRQNHYKPTNALRGSVSLMLEVPFFMAAYRFLSGLLIIKKCSFGTIMDLGEPDGLLFIGGVAINLLPILMTLINILSAEIYTKELPLKSKVQLYGMALMFLVLLYDSPSALVLYWTLNNIFSLVKNILARMKYSRQIIAVSSSVLSLSMIVNLLFFNPMASLKRQLLLLLLLGMLQIPLLKLLHGKYSYKQKPAVIPERADRKLFFTCGILLTIITGLLIPSAIVANAPDEFVNATTLSNPILYVFSAFLTAAGTFLVWSSIFYTLAPYGVQKIMSRGACVIAVGSIVNYLFFGKNYGILSPNLKFDLPPIASTQEVILNLFVLALVTAAVLLLWFKKKEWIQAFCAVAALSLFIMSVIHFPTISEKAKSQIKEYQNSASDTFSIPLSKHGKNVVVLMMDKAVGLNVPYIFEEKPELKAQFEGFSYYPNTLSHGLCTNTGSPGIFGGYEYTPDQMNRNLNQTLEQKHDEALRVLPRIFLDQDYKVTIVDPPLAGYGVVSPSSLYEEYPGLNAYWLLHKYTYVAMNYAKAQEIRISRNLFYYSLFKISPVCIQPVLYSEGAYNDLDELKSDLIKVDNMASYEQITNGPSRATGLNSSFMTSYNELKDLPNMTEIQESDQNTFFTLANNLPHSPMILKVPEYEPAKVVDNREYDEAHKDRFIYEGHAMSVDKDNQMANYHCNMASMILLGKWFDYLRENDVYDNTRIIVVSDHGALVGHYDELLFIDKWPYDVLGFNALMMVKDFDDHNDFRMDETFMTNADVPALATKDLIDHPVNPFTGKPIDSHVKDKSAQILFMSGEWDFYKNNTPQYLPHNWYAVSPDIFSRESWKKIGNYSLLPEQ